MQLLTPHHVESGRLLQSVAEQSLGRLLLASQPMREATLDRRVTIMGAVAFIPRPPESTPPCDLMPAATGHTAPGSQDRSR